MITGHELKMQFIITCKLFASPVCGGKPLTFLIVAIFMTFAVVAIANIAYPACGGTSGLATEEMTTLSNVARFI
jgi:hypothetical protein